MNKLKTLWGITQYYMESDMQEPIAKVMYIPMLAKYKWEIVDRSGDYYERHTSSHRQVEWMMNIFYIKPENVTFL